MPRYLILCVVIMVCYIPSTLGVDRIGYYQRGPRGSMDMGQDFMNVHRYSNKSERSNRSKDHLDAYSEALGEGFEIRMLWVPSGAFWMGIANKDNSGMNENWLHAVKIDRPFFIQETSINSLQMNYLLGKKTTCKKTIDLQFSGVTWYDTITFCNILSRDTNLEPCYYSDPDFTKEFTIYDALASRPVFWKESANGYRLPTEAEWEYSRQVAAEKSSDSMNMSSLGNDPGWEWCWDWFDQFPSHNVTNPKGPESGEFRVVKGNQLQQDVNFLHSRRSCLKPAMDNHSLRFRIARFAE
jgi:Sulfatase-modifying factor enzyme 1